jgi:hypothetical protein
MVKESAQLTSQARSSTTAYLGYAIYQRVLCAMQQPQQTLYWEHRVYDALPYSTSMTVNCSLCSE